MSWNDLHRLFPYRGGVTTRPVLIRASVEVSVKDTKLDSQSLLLFPATGR